METSLEKTVIGNHISSIRTVVNVMLRFMIFPVDAEVCACKHSQTYQQERFFPSKECMVNPLM